MMVLIFKSKFSLELRSGLSFTLWPSQLIAHLVWIFQNIEVEQSVQTNFWLLIAVAVVLVPLMNILLAVEFVVVIFMMENVLLTLAIL